MVTYDDIRSIALALPETHEKASYGGQPSWRTSQRMFVWIRDAPEALVVWVDSEAEKLAAIETAPTKFFTTDHYEGHPIVLVRLGHIDRDEATELIHESWRQRGPKRLVKAFFDD